MRGWKCVKKCVHILERFSQNIVMWLLIFLFGIFILSFVFLLFHMAFVRGKIFDISKTKLGSRSKMKKHLKAFNENLEFIQNMPFEWHYIKSFDDLKLAGRFFRCENSDRLVIMFPGYRSIGIYDFSFYFKMYYESGFNILLVDNRAQGKSEGKYITFGINERIDCLYWCEYACENFKEVNEIILAGISMGATTALLATELNLPNKVKGLVADSSFTSPKLIISNVLGKHSINYKIIIPILNIFCKLILKFDLNNYSAIDTLKNNNLPILFVHGLSDDFVPSKMTKENYNVCASEKELLLIDCVNHGMSCVYDYKKVNNVLQNFLKSLA